MKIEYSYKILSATDESLGAVVQITASTGLSKWTLSDYAAELDRTDSIFNVADHPDGSVVGFIVGRIIPSSSSGDALEAEIYNIGVVSGVRRTGAGAALLSSFIAHAKVAGVSAVWLEVRSMNFHALKFYERAGFEAVADRKEYYSDPVDDAIIMRSTI